MARRCWGITKDIKRCARLGEWWFFCNEHFSLKSVLLVAGFFAAVIAFLSDSKSIFSGMLYDEEKFIGTWKENFEFQYGGVNAQMNGQISYFKNGRYNLIGELRYSTPSPKSIILIYKVMAAGTWIADDSTLTISREDHDYEFQGVNTGFGEKIDAQLKDRVISENKFDLKLINGISDQYQILESAGNEMQLEGETPERIKFIVKMTRI